MAANLPEPSCPSGYTATDLVSIFGIDGLPDFNKYMTGQTCMICNGRQYNHETKQHEPSGCVGNPHGVVTYVCDVERYFAKKAGIPIAWD